MKFIVKIKASQTSSAASHEIEADKIVVSGEVILLEKDGYNIAAFPIVDVQSVIPKTGVGLG